MSNKFLAAKTTADRPPPTAADAMREADRLISERAQWMRAQCGNQDRVGIERAWQWERSARQDAGLAVPPIARPFTQNELANMLPAMEALGLKYGFLVRRADGSIFEVDDDVTR